jgi:hypothetical protein
MTKLSNAEDILYYQIEMALIVRQVIQKQFIDGVRISKRAAPPLLQMGMLPPPGIVGIDLSIYEGREEDVILINTSANFGVEIVQVTIHDRHGNVIEEGEAMEEPYGSGSWAYFAEVSIPSGTSVIVHVNASDCLGGVGARRAEKIIP